MGEGRRITSSARMRSNEHAASQIPTFAHSRFTMYDFRCTMYDLQIHRFTHGYDTDLCGRKWLISPRFNQSHPRGSDAKVCKGCHWSHKRLSFHVQIWVETPSAPRGIVPIGDSARLKWRLSGTSVNKEMMCLAASFDRKDLATWHRGSQLSQTSQTSGENASRQMRPSAPSPSSPYPPSHDHDETMAADSFGADPIDLPPGAKPNLTDDAHPPPTRSCFPVLGAFNQDRRGKMPKPNTDRLRLETV